ncbi:GNAT family N-acetyltransferase [Dyadobacter tibetensis]|uniref:GNAT family N-acetyltransferase n=1 Tax=Dyadobacter tibetensis TaxID=1211851 RepID=UPI0004AE9955|nr:GNAT family N-acetyltransferase [Dyadobacter tibetensis]
MKDIIIRDAQAADAGSIARLLLLAMREIVSAFIHDQNEAKALAFLNYFTALPANQYSYENCLVAEHKGRVIAVVNVYNGAYLPHLRRPIAEYINQQLHLPFTPEDESEVGEWYIDTLGVDPNYQGQGLGSTLLKTLIDRYVVRQKGTLGLLVDMENSRARRLYLNLGFEVKKEKPLMGKMMEHLQLNS